MALALAVLLCLASGYLIAAIGWPRRPSPADFPVLASLAAGCGLGLFSFAYVLSRAAGNTHLIATDLALVGLLLIAFLLIHRPEPAQISELASDWQANFAARRILTAVSLFALAVAFYAAITRAIVHPHGEGWDAFSIWNLHARFLFRSGSPWRDGFSSLIPWSHPDYPLLLPGAIAHFWTYLGNETQAIPAVIAIVFTFATVGLLFSSLAMLRGRIAAMLASLALLTTPFFIEQGTSQYADVPLSFFILAAIVLLCLHDAFAQNESSGTNRLLLLAGVNAGFAAWTKNEGLLFLFALIVARAFSLIREAGRSSSAARRPQPALAAIRPFLPLLIGMAPALLLIGWFKLFIAPPGDLFPDRALAFHKLFEPSRYGAVLRWYGKEFLRFGEWLLIPGTLLLIAFYFLTRRKNVPQERGFEAGLPTGAITLSLTLAGYFVIYLVTPRDIYWHLRNSLNRLFLQLWPSAIFLFFLLITPIVKKSAHVAKHSDLKPAQ